MHLNLESTQKLTQVFYCIFVLISSINKISFSVVTAENISNIPLRLYQTKQSESPQLQHSTLDEKLEDVFKRATQTDFYGLRGKMLPDGGDAESLEEKRSAFYPMRGKKKAAAFTALRGKKEFNSDIYDSESYNKAFNQMPQEKNSAPLQSSMGSESGKAESSNNPYFSLLHTDNESVLTQPWKNILNQEKISFNSADDLSSKIVDDDSKLYDNILAKVNDENESDDDQMINKRRNSGFIPMRGRKFYSDVSSQFQNDKRKSSFIPMRGRKATNVDKWPALNDEFTSPSDKKSVGFLPMRGRRSIFSQVRTNRFQQKTRWPFSEGKRVAFHAVRGKKNSLDDWNYPRRSFYSSQNGKFDDYDNEDTSGYDDTFNRNFAASTNHGSLLRIRRSLQGKMTRGKSRQTVGIKRPATFFASRGKRFENDVLPQSSLYLL